MGIIIKEGKFFKDGVEIKPEFGNWEQINLLKKYQEEQEEKVKQKEWQLKKKLPK